MPMATKTADSTIYEANLVFHTELTISPAVRPPTTLGRSKPIYSRLFLAGNGRSNRMRNCNADDLVRLGTTLQISWYHESVGMHLRPSYMG